MTEIDWKQDYQGEFICPECQTLGMSVWGIKKPNNKRAFSCPACRHVCLESCQIHIRAVVDPINVGVTWYTNHRIEDFVCPECQAKNVYFTRIDNYGKKRFVCRSCQKGQYESIQLTTANHSRFSDEALLIKPFKFDEDARALSMCASSREGSSMF